MIIDPPSRKLPALRISHIVYGRENVGNRVKYFVDPKGLVLTKAIPEEVVLRRWRQRKLQGYTFRGARLNPNLWRKLPNALGLSIDLLVKLPPNEISAIISQAKINCSDGAYALPPPQIALAILQVVGSERLHALLARHNDPKRHDRYGTPDLFLYAEETGFHSPQFARFVEVKKPDEPLSNDQKEEIDFLNNLGLQARVLRLIERP